MKLCVLGWYGTETLGDRAILDGILKIFESDGYSSNEVLLGSLYPFFTQRTLHEDASLLSMHGCKVSLFDELDRSELESSIKRSDIVIMGGGPLMAIHEMHVIYAAFKRARRLGKKTVLLGCGYGPFNRPDYISLTRKILVVTDLAVFRDSLSLNAAHEQCGDLTRMEVLDDPAIISALSYRARHRVNKRSDYAAVNFRDFPAVHYGPRSTFSSCEAAEIVDAFASFQTRVMLVPMHTFFVGGDDRVFLFEVKKQCTSRNVEIVSNPPSLERLYELYSNANTCIGMRYHAVVLQTILNGNNYIVDYTGQDGKIDSFIKMYDKAGCLLQRRLLVIGSSYQPMNERIPVVTQAPQIDFNLQYDPVFRYRSLLESAGIL